MRSTKGFTIVELIFYVGLVSLLGTSAMFLVFNVSDVAVKVRNQTHVLSQGRIAMDSILSEVKYAQSVYTPTSDLASNIGYLSLATPIGVPTDERYAFVDFYIVNGRLYTKREGQASYAITSERVTITKLKFTRLLSGSTSEGVMVELALQENPRSSQPTKQVNVAFRSTGAMRGNK
jgi:type II secretory pathway pseudopilin PulG